MDTFTPHPNRLKVLRILLAARLSALRGALQATEATRAQQRVLGEMRQVETALGQMGRASYGHCDACSRALPLSQLMAQPTAQRCTACLDSYGHRRELSARKSAAALSGAIGLPIR